MYTMMSSRYPSVHGADKTVRGHPEIIMLAELLKSHGYRTEAYNANPIMYGGLGFEDGFDVYIEHGDVLPLVAFNKTTAYRFVKKLRDAIFERSNVAGGDSTEWLTERLLRAFNKKRRRPLFLWAHYLDPHTPLTPPREYVRGTPEFVEGALRFGRSETIFYENLVVEDLDVLIPLYEAEVRYVDDKFGGVLTAMEDNGYFENSIIIVTADHGEEFFEHGEYGHGKTHYNEVISIPMFIYTPDGEPGTTDYPVSLIDIMPTVLEYVGAEVPSDTDMSGESLLPLIEGSSKGRKDKYIFIDRIQTDPNLKSARFAPYTLIRSGANVFSYEMVDNTITTSPDDIVENPDPEVYDAMWEALDKWATATDEEAEALGEVVEVKLDAGRREKLKGLGYLK
jgi:arylsulfatase